MICSPFSMYSSLFSPLKVDSDPFNNSYLKNYNSSREGRKPRCLNVFPFEGLMAEVLVTNRMEWCGVRWLLQKQGQSGGQMCTGRNTDTPSRSLMFTLVISNLPGICQPACFPLKELVSLK